MLSTGARAPARHGKLYQSNRSMLLFALFECMALLSILAVWRGIARPFWGLGGRWSCSCPRASPLLALPPMVNMPFVGRFNHCLHGGLTPLHPAHGIRGTRAVMLVVPNLAACRDFLHAVTVVRTAPPPRRTLVRIGHRRVFSLEGGLRTGSIWIATASRSYPLRPDFARTWFSDCGRGLGALALRAINGPTIAATRANRGTR